MTATGWWTCDMVPFAHDPKKVMFWLAHRVGRPYQVSRRGVPHLVLPTHDGQCSVCWFGRNKFFRVFTPYPGEPTERVDCKAPRELYEELVRLGAVVEDTGKVRGG